MFSAMEVLRNDNGVGDQGRVATAWPGVAEGASAGAGKNAWEAAPSRIGAAPVGGRRVSLITKAEPQKPASRTSTMRARVTVARCCRRLQSRDACRKGVDPGFAG